MIQFIPRIYNKIIINILGYFWGVTIPEVVGEVDQHPIGEGSDEQAIVVMDSPEIGFHGQSASKTAPTADLGEVPELMRRSLKVFLPGRLLAGQTRLRLPGPGAVGCCFPIDYYCILIFLHKARLSLWRKY